MSLLLSAREIRKSFGARTLLDGIDLYISEGDKIGFIGANGSGKSTFLSILAGKEKADEGEVVRRRGLRVGYLAQEPPFLPERTAREEVSSGLSEIESTRAKLQEIAQKLSGAREGDDLSALLEEQAALQRRLDEWGGWATEHRVEEVIEALGIREPDRPLGTLSGGERKRAILGGLLLSQPELILLDEPTNHLDADTTLWLEGFLQNFSGGLFFVTHDRYFLDRVATRTVELYEGKCTSYEGGFEEYLEAKEERLARAAREEEIRLNLLRTELEWLRRQPKARGTKQKARIERVQAMAAVRPVREKTIDLGEGFLASRQGKTILELTDLTVTLGEKPILDKVSFALRAGERIGVIGPNGVGKSTLLQAIAGKLPVGPEMVRIGARTQISYFAQHRAALPQESTIWEVVGGGSDFVDVGEKRFHLVGYLSRFLFPPETHRQKIKSLSGGEKARVELALLLRQKANVLLFDEPTNDLDLPTLQALEAALVEFGGSAIVVTHDRYFLDKIATAIVVLEPSETGAKATRYEGNYQTYRALRDAKEEEERKLSSKPEKPEKAQKRVSAPEAQKPRLTFAEEKELAEISSKIEQAEAVKVGLEARLADPALYRGPAEEIKKIQEGLEKTNRVIEALYARWAELEEKEKAAR